MAKESLLIGSRVGEIEVGIMWARHQNKSNTFLLVYFCFVILVQHFGRCSNIPEKYIAQVHR